MPFIADDLVVAAAVLRGVYGATAACLAQSKKSRRGAKEMCAVVVDLQRTAAIFATDSFTFDKALRRAARRAAVRSGSDLMDMIVDEIADEWVDDDDDDDDDNNDDDDGGEWDEVSNLTLFANREHKTKMEACLEVRRLQLFFSSSSSSSSSFSLFALN